MNRTHIYSIISILVLALATMCGTAFAVSPMPPHTDYRPGYDSSCDGGAACHNLNKGIFLTDTLDSTEAPDEKDYTNFCLSCHNVSGEAHEKAAGSPSTNAYKNLTGFKDYSSYKGVSHSWNGVNRAAGTRTPTLVGFTKSIDGTDYMPGGKVRCQTCHSAMDKPYENINFAPGADQGDHKRYKITTLPAINSTKQYLSQYIRVYRNLGSALTLNNSRTKKLYLVSPSEYTYDYTTACVVFTTAQSQSPLAYIYIDIGEPYLREDDTANRVCLDCHNDRRDTRVSHPSVTPPSAKDHHPVSVTYRNQYGLHSTVKPAAGSNVYLEGGKVYCTSCHKPHNAASNNGQLLRNADSSALCADCHKVNGFGGNTTALLANHSGPLHRAYGKPVAVCLDCHTAHGSAGIMLVRNVIKGKRVVFQNFSGLNSFGDDTGAGVCEVCHENTSFHQSNGGGKGHNNQKNCLRCHKHSKGFKATGGGGLPCYSCHDGTINAPNIKTLMGLGTSFSSGGKSSRHIITFDTISSSTCLNKCHTNNHNTGEPNLKAQELELCYSASCHDGGAQTTSAGKSIDIGSSFTASRHNYTTSMPNSSGRFRYPANCTKCHQPHGDTQYPLMRATINNKATNGNGEDLCFGCHDSSMLPEWNIKDLWKAGYPDNKGHYDYANSKRMACVSCHGAHGTRNKMMIKDSIGGPGLEKSDICLACHSGNGSVYNVRSGQPGSYTYGNASATSTHDFGLNVAIGGYTMDLTCVGCHDPHYTKNARLLQSKVFYSSTSGTKFYIVSTVGATVKRFGPISSYTGGWNKYCALCHVSMKETGGQSPYRRHPVGRFDTYTTAKTGYIYNNYINNKAGRPEAPLESNSVSCITCHYTHGSPRRSLLRFQNKTTPENRQCLKCHDKGEFLGGGPGSHGGFLRDQGECSDCHNMHTMANKKLLKEAKESVLCYSCHAPNGSRRALFPEAQLVWKGNAPSSPAEWAGTGGSFGSFSSAEVFSNSTTGGTAYSIHDVNNYAKSAWGGATTEHNCGTCHNPHGSKNYRILRKIVNNVTGIYVYANTDLDGKFISYSSGLVKFCTACHTSYGVTDDGIGNWIRHPVGVELGNYTSEKRFYDNMTSYKPKVELESRGTVSCVTCHYAHGSSANANLKFPGGKTVNACKTCHNRSFNAGTQGSHAGFTGNNGTCSDCHSMHASGNAKLLKAGAETEVCVNCHDSPGTSDAINNPNKSHLDVWKGNVLDNPTSWFGTAGSFGAYDPVNGGNAPSMHPVNADARIAPGDSATVVHCGTCHDSHGSTNYRLLKTVLNGKGANGEINVTASVDERGRTVSYGSGMSSFCTACHKTYATSGSAAGYTRHPVDVAMTATEMAIYNHFQGRKFLPLESGNKVTCITCHFAHGSPYARMKRLDGNQMCQTCHAKGLDTTNNYAAVQHTHGGFNGNSGNCLTCHYIHRNVFNHVTGTLNRKMLVESEESTLCYSCHGPDGNRRGSFPTAQVVWRGDMPSYPTEWDGTGGSFGSFYNTSSGGTIKSHHDINLTNEPAPGGSSTTTEHRCGTCHNPHGNNNYRLLRDDVNGGSGLKVLVNALGNYSSGMSSFCVACHTSYGESGASSGGYRRHPVNLTLTAWAQTNLATTALEPKVQVENKKVMCLSCHFAHGSPSYAMLRMQTYTSSESEMCQQCHLKGYNKSRTQYRYTHGGFNGNKANCGVCHTTHSKNNKKLLVEAKESELCNNCHAGIGAFNDFKNREPKIKIDAPSRFNVFSSLGNSFGNYSVGGGDVVSWHEVDGVHTAPGGKTLELRCGKCHSPHGSDNFVMIRDTIENVTGIRVFGHLSSTGPFNTYSSGFGRFCSACHTKLTNCKTGNTWTRHPVDFKLKDTQFKNWSTTNIQPKMPIETGHQVTCITCHNSHGSKNYFLQRLGGNRMCQQCHRR